MMSYSEPFHGEYTVCLGISLSFALKLQIKPQVSMRILSS